MDASCRLDPGTKMRKVAAAELDRLIYVIGGPWTQDLRDTVQAYDPGTDTWVYTTPLPQAAHHTVAAAVNRRLYVMGGAAPGGGVFDTVYEYGVFP